MSNVKRDSYPLNPSLEETSVVKDDDKVFVHADTVEDILLYPPDDERVIVNSEIGLKEGALMTPLTTNENEATSLMFVFVYAKLILGEMTEQVEEHEIDEISKSDGNYMESVPVGV